MLSAPPTVPLVINDQAVTLNLNFADGITADTQWSSETSSAAEEG